MCAWGGVNLTELLMDTSSSIVFGALEVSYTMLAGRTYKSQLQHSLIEVLFEEGAGERVQETLAEIHEESSQVVAGSMGTL